MVNRFSYAYVSGRFFPLYLRLAATPPPGLDSLPGYLTPDEGLCLHWLALQVPPGCIAVEIGSFKGKSSSYIASGLVPGARLACVDVWENRAMPYDPPEDVLPEFQRNVAPYRDKIDIHKGLSADVAKNWPALIDLLFIDGDHSYEGCIGDIKAWLPHVRAGGWVAFHDSGQEGVERAVRERFPRAARSLGVRAGSIFAARKR
ncbi:MAG: class I SAM-dependent methyltransferase [Polyangiaceae bacterium]|nr:class I SAM-dependent methyltransferase [Polyangiaceae bacterium]NUQ74713.1 class I SAM-dependent methyltransferase [Polyangiaceae bacterium]